MSFFSLLLCHSKSNTPPSSSSSSSSFFSSSSKFKKWREGTQSSLLLGLCCHGAHRLLSTRLQTSGSSSNLTPYESKLNFSFLFISSLKRRLNESIKQLETFEKMKERRKNVGQNKAVSEQIFKPTPYPRVVRTKAASHHSLNSTQSTGD